MRSIDETTRRHLRHRLAAPARAAVAATLAAGRAAYDRTTSLPRLLPLMPAELADFSEAAGRKIVARLARALRAERNRGRAGHWTYDLNRHIALRQAYEAERRRLPSRRPLRASDGDAASGDRPATR